MYYRIGDQSIEFDLGYTSEFPLKIKGKSIELIPKQRNFGGEITFNLNDSRLKPGYYKMMIGDSIVNEIALNYNRYESDISNYSRNEVKEMITANNLNAQLIDAEVENLSLQLEEEEKGIKIWKYFLALALVFIGIETLFLRILK